MKKRTLSRLLAWALSLCLVSGLLPISVLAAELQNVDTLSNENLQVLVDKRSGGFSIRTLEGDAIRKDDNNKNLLFPLGEDDTTTTRTSSSPWERTTPPLPPSGSPGTARPRTMCSAASTRAPLTWR